MTTLRRAVSRPLLTRWSIKHRVIREKPFLYMDSRGDFRVFVPAIRTNSQGVSWSSRPMAGTSIPLRQVLRRSSRVFHRRDHQCRSRRGQTHSLHARRVPVRRHAARHPGQHGLIGLGFPSLVETTGRSISSVGDVGGVKIAGHDIGCRTGELLGAAVRRLSLVEADHASNPTFLYDLTVRTGGAWPGRNDMGIRIDSNNVVLDQVWIWRADHGAGIGWGANPTQNGLVVNGDDVTCYGLFNEHHEGYQTLWNGNRGRVYMYQSELPYDVPDQTAWMNGETEGFASYKVAPHVTTHEAWGLGIYCFFPHSVVRAHTAIEAPSTTGIKLHNLTTIWLSGRPGSQITHVVNEVGGAVTSSAARRQTLNLFP